MHHPTSATSGGTWDFSIFLATLLTCSELISWTKKSDDIFLFFEHVGGSIHQKKLFGNCYDRSTRL